MTDQQHPTQPAATGALLPAYRWLATLFAALIVVQAYLATSGVFNAEEWMVTGHGHLANGMFALIIVQTVLAWVLYTREALGLRDVVLNALLVALTVSQIGLGYSTRNGENYGTVISLHIPNGVLLMGISATVAAMAWLAATRAVPAPHAASRPAAARGVQERGTS
jgi:hypothetical protein